MKVSYTYRGKALRVLDGDTVQVDLDLGFQLRFLAIIRLARINAPEVVGETKAAGIAATKAMAELLGCNYAIGVVKGGFAPAKAITVRVLKADKYGGRWVGEIFIGDACVNDQMVSLGHAVPYLVDRDLPDDPFAGDPE